jgi:hypothetical protein
MSHTVQAVRQIGVGPYHYLCDGHLTNCVPQPGTDRRLDAPGDKIVARRVYRSIGNHESVVTVHPINAPAGAGGVRRYEFCVNKDRGVKLHQQGTYAPDNLYRWVASPEMDRFGTHADGR